MTRVILSSRRPMLRPASSPDQVSWLADPPTPRPSRRFASGVAGFVPVHSCGAAPAFTGFPSIRAVRGSVAVYLMAWLSREVSGERRSMNGEARCAHALVLPRRQVGDARPAGLLALGSSYSPRLPSPYTGQWLSRVSSPNTVTGSRRIRTAFPIAPLGNSSAKRRHLIKPRGTGSICFAILRCERPGSPQRALLTLAWISVFARLASGCGSPIPPRLGLPARSRLVRLATCPSARDEIDPLP